MRSFIICTVPTKCFSGDQTKKNEMSGACGTYGGLERYRHRWEDNIKIVIQESGLGEGGYGLDCCGSG